MIRSRWQIWRWSSCKLADGHTRLFPGPGRMKEADPFPSCPSSITQPRSELSAPAEPASASLAAQRSSQPYSGVRGGCVSVTMPTLTAPSPIQSGGKARVTWCRSPGRTDRQAGVPCARQQVRSHSYPASPQQGTPAHAAFGALGQTRRGPGGRAASATTVSACGGQQIAQPPTAPEVGVGLHGLESVTLSE